MRAYHEIVQTVLNNGKIKKNRTNVRSFGITGAMFRHDMGDGFPLLTTKKMFFKGVKTELEFFLKGFTSKKWLQDRGNHIWDEWCSPKKIPYARDEITQKAMKNEDDLGPIYGYQWRNFNGPYGMAVDEKNYEKNEKTSGKGVDQLFNIVKELKKNPFSRRLYVSAWNPCQLDEMALPPCHYGFQLTVSPDEKGNPEQLNLLWNQRSVDVMLGLPFNIASYGLLLHLLAKEATLNEGELIGFLGDVHIYENHMENAKLQMERDPTRHFLPKVETNFPMKNKDKSENFSIFQWESAQTKLQNYIHDSAIDFQISV